MTMFSGASQLIYSSCVPIVKIYVWVACGYVLCKLGVLRPVVSRMCSKLFMNVALPSLIFANTVPAFTPQNAPAMVPLFATAFIYQIIGFIFGMIIRELLYVPRNFWQGIVVMCGMNNWSNLPTSVVMSVMEQPPFDSKVDPQLGVSFVSFFIVSYHIMFWVMGVAYTLAWDYLPGIPQGEAAEQRCRWYEKPLGSVLARFLLKREVPIMFPPFTTQIEQKPPGPEETRIHTMGELLVNSPGKLHATSSSAAYVSSTSTVNNSTPLLQRSSPSPPHVLLRILRVLISIFTPITTSLFVSIPVALIPQLKGLFVPLSTAIGDGVRINQKPPLFLVIYVAQLLGSTAVPLALLVLGASFARCRIPRPFSRLPIAAMLACAAAKMVVLPIIGVFMVRMMVKRGIIDKDAKVEQFVVMFLSGTPAAVNQLIAASLYAPDGDVDLQAVFFLVQYVFMFFTSSALTAVCLLLLK